MFSEDTILKAISFGRNVFANFQRFIMFQLTVNLSSMSIIIAFLLMGLESPFSSTTLLWLNIIMDGPLALSLALEKRPLVYSGKHPVKRSADILGGKLDDEVIAEVARRVKEGGKPVDMSEELAKVKAEVEEGENIITTAKIDISLLPQYYIVKVELVNKKGKETFIYII